MDYSQNNGKRIFLLSSNLLDTKINICITFDQLLISKQDSEKISEVQRYMEKNVDYYTILN